MSRLPPRSRENDEDLSSAACALAVVTPQHNVTEDELGDVLKAIAFFGQWMSKQPTPGHIGA